MPGRADILRPPPLDTWGHAADAFIAAYAASDYWLVYQILAPETQRAIDTDIQTFAFGELTPMPRPGSGDDRQIGIEDPKSSDHPFDIAWMFDGIMLAAQARTRLPFVLSSPLKTSPGEGEPPGTIVAGMDGPVRITLVQAPSGRWRVLSATTKGHEASRPPWGLGPSTPR